MSDDTIERWVATWDSAGKALETLRRGQLQAMSDDDVRRAVADLFEGTHWLKLRPRITSGLVEQQRLFSRLRRSA